jgi:hypothetical protein
MRNNDQRKRPNALKHGVYASAPIIEGEDPREFEALHAELREEWMPDGALEEDTVASIAMAIWRKRRAQEFLQVQLMTTIFDVENRFFDEAIGFRAFATLINEKPEGAFEEASRFLRPNKIDYLKKKFPPSHFKSPSEWAHAVINEIRTELLPAVTFKVPEAPKGSKEWVELMDEAGRLQKKMASLHRATFSSDLFEQELARHERLDAMIDRSIKRLIQIKSTKQILRQISTEREDNQPLKLVAKRTTK